MARKEVQPPRRIKVNLSLDAQLRRRLGAYAAFHGRDESAVVAEALESVLKGFVVHQRSTSPASGDHRVDGQADAPQLRAAG